MFVSSNVPVTELRRIKSVVVMPHTQWSQLGKKLKLALVSCSCFSCM